MMDLIAVCRRLILRPSAIVLYRHRLPRSFAVLHWFTDEEVQAGKLFIGRRWCVAVDLKPAQGA